MVRGIARSERDHGGRISSGSAGGTVRSLPADPSSRHTVVANPDATPARSGAGHLRHEFVTALTGNPGDRLLASIALWQTRRPPCGTPHRPSHSEPSKTAQRSTVARRRLIVGIVVAIVAVVGLFLLFGGKDNNPIASFIDPPPPVGEVSFAKVDAAYEATATTPDRDHLQNTANKTAPDVAKVVAEFFQNGYADPDGWGDAGAIDGSVHRRRRGAGRAERRHAYARHRRAQFEPRPGKSTITVTSLVDKDGNAVRAMGDVTFTGTTTNDDGTYTDVTVTGTLFLVPTGDGWKIEAFRLQRNEKPGTAPETPSSSPTESS